MHDLGEGEAAAINDAGQIVGHKVFADSVHAFLYSPASGFRDLGAMGNFYSVASDINNRGQVVGQFTVDSIDSPEVSFLWSESTGMVPLPVGLNSNPYDINDNGEIVGNGGLGLHGPYYPFYFDGADAFNLNDLIDPASGWRITGAWSINNAGQILGGAEYDPDGPGGTPPLSTRVLLTPIPEPAGACFAAIGAVSMLRRGRRV